MYIFVVYRLFTKIDGLLNWVLQKLNRNLELHPWREQKIYRSCTYILNMLLAWFFPRVSLSSEKYFIF